MTLSRGLLDLRPLRASPPFRRLWGSSMLGALGGQIAVVAVLFQVWDMTHNPFWTGAIGLANAVPLVVFGMVGGTLADAVDRRSLVRWATVGQALAGLGLAAQAAAGAESLWLVLALVSAQGAASAVGAPARRTFIPRLLGPEQVGAGIALQLLTFQGAMLIGPALGGLIIGRWGVGACYLTFASLVALSLYGVVRLPSMPPEGAGTRPGLRSTVAGFSYVLQRPVLRGSFASDLAATLLSMPVALFPLVNEVRFGGDPETLGLFLSCIAVGGMSAGLFSGLVTRADRPGRIQLAAAAVWGVALAVFGLAGPLWLALAVLVVAGAADTVSVTSRGLMIQLATPDSHRGRVSAVDHVVGVAGPDVGNFRAGIVAGLTSAPVALATGGLACAAVVGWIALRNRPLRTFSIHADAAPDPSVRTG
ncbi:MFS transporter [Ornithinimicrobium cavernae]|uniref:MFS transporter n=1 Tax=Ornithinimicrobium cavernae TaxID=2666047 RepID=UPI000D68BCC2|nr:MFS transporter [Ornithinimicrobium cavernae]